MKNHTLEIYVDRAAREATCWRSSPAYGESHEPQPNFIQRMTLNDGVNRVKVAVYKQPLTLDEIKTFARIAVTQPVQKWNS